MKGLEVDEFHTDCSMKGIDIKEIDKIENNQDDDLGNAIRGGQETAAEYYDRIKKEQELEMTKEQQSSPERGKESSIQNSSLGVRSPAPAKKWFVQQDEYSILLE